MQACFCVGAPSKTTREFLKSASTKVADHMMDRQQSAILHSPSELPLRLESKFGVKVFCSCERPHLPATVRNSIRIRNEQLGQIDCTYTQPSWPAALGLLAVQMCIILAPDHLPRQVATVTTASADIQRLGRLRHQRQRPSLPPDNTAASSIHITSSLPPEPGAAMGLHTKKPFQSIRASLPKSPGFKSYQSPRVALRIHIGEVGHCDMSPNL